MEHDKLLANGSSWDVLQAYLKDEEAFRNVPLEVWLERAARELNKSTVADEIQLRRFLKWNSAEDDLPTSYAKLLAFGGILTPLSREFTDVFWVVKKAVEEGRVDYAIEQLMTWNAKEDSENWGPGLLALARVGRWKEIADFLDSEFLDSASSRSIPDTDIRIFVESDEFVEFVALFMTSPMPEDVYGTIEDIIGFPEINELLFLVTAITGKTPLREQRVETSDPGGRDERLEAEQKPENAKYRLKAAIQYDHPEQIATIDVESMSDDDFVSALVKGNILSKTPLKDKEIWEVLKNTKLSHFTIEDIFKTLAESGLPKTKITDKFTELMDKKEEEATEDGEFVDPVSASDIPSSSLLFDLYVNDNEELPEDFVSKHAADPLAIVGALAVRELGPDNKSSANEFTNWDEIVKQSKGKMVNEIVRNRESYNDFMSFYRVFRPT